MDFYSLLSKYYDDVFPVSDEKLEFFVHWFQKHRVKTVLDVACGSGLLARRLAAAGYEVLGIDLEEDMILQALEQAEADGIRARFMQGDMRKLADLLKQSDGSGYRQFDGVSCVGNSLAHLLRVDEIQSVLRQMFALTSAGGVAIVQVVNFDRILAQGATDLPDIVREDKEFAFYRRYIPGDGDLVKFQSRLVLLESGQSFTNEITLRAIRKAELETMLRDSGYTALRFFGGFKDVPYSDDSYATVVVAEKA